MRGSKNLVLDQLAPWIAGCACAVVYLLTQAPGLMYTDTGELAAAAATWGVAHPTGYPLLTLIGHVWCLLPWPSVIGALNVLAALFTATGVAMSGMVVRAILPESGVGRPWVVMATTLLLGFSTLVWSQSTAFEVYGLSLLLVSSALLATLKATDSQSTRWTLLAGMLFGLSLANHISTVFLAPGLLVLWWRRGRTRAEWMTLVLPIVLGLSLYAILPLRSATLPPINWGWVHRSWEDFFYHVRGTQFGVWMFSDSKAFSANLSTFMRSASHTLLWVGWLPVVIGLVELWRTQRRLLLSILLLVLGNLGISLGYAIPDIDSYFLPTTMVLTLLFGVGLTTLIKRLPQSLTAAALVVPLISLGLNVKEMNYREHRAVEGYAEWTWANLEPNAVVISRQWDFVLSAMWYQQTVEGVRPDVAIIDKELMRRTWYIPHLTHLYPGVMKGAQAAINDYTPWLRTFESDADAFMKNPANPPAIQQRFIAVLNALLESNAQRPLYITPEILKEERGFAPAYTAIPVGPFYRLTRDSTLRPRTSTAGLDKIHTSLKSPRTRLDSALRETVMGILSADAIYAYHFLADTSMGKHLRDRVVALDPKSPITRNLTSRLP